MKFELEFYFMYWLVWQLFNVEKRTRTFLPSLESEILIRIVLY